jgi:Toprim domain
MRSSRRWHSNAKVEFDAMVAIIIHPSTGRFLGIHATYLECLDGVWRKANVTPQKITFGPIRGGIIPLTRGATGLLIRQACGEELLLGEGIENCLSAALLFPELRCWSSTSVGNLLAIAIPRQFRRIRLIRDRDGKNEGVRSTRKEAIARWLNEGRNVRFLDPPPGFKDLNDWWRARQVGRRRGRPDSSAPPDGPAPDARDAA